MYVTKELLEIELANLRKQHEQVLANGNALTGAIQFCEHLLSTMTGKTLIPEGSETQDANS